MSAVGTIARTEMRSAFRNGMLLAAALLFLGMSVLSVYIGSATKRAEMRVYDQRVAELTAQGATQFPQAPEVHTLTVLFNLVEYVAMIGVIVAIMLGYDTITRERETGALHLVLSRPVYRDRLFTGLIVGKIGVLGLIMGVAFLFNLLLVNLVGTLRPTVEEMLRLAAFSVLAWTYMGLFLVLAAVMSTGRHPPATAFLVSLVVWMLVSYVIPQLADALMTHSSVANSVTGAIQHTPQETALSRALNALSPASHFRAIGGELLESTPGSVSVTAGRWVLDWLGGMAITVGLSGALLAVGYARLLRDDRIITE